MTKTSRHRCQFCGAIGRPSKEHILSEWLQDILPQTASASDHFLEHRIQHGEFVEKVEKTGLFHRPGDPLSLTARTACSDCNSGWMSRIVNNAKGPIKRLALLDWSPLSDVDRTHLASWAALVTMNIEQGDPVTAAVPQIDRDHIMKYETAPQFWRFWIGKYRDLMPTKLHEGMELVESDQASTAKCNTQTTIFNVGLLLIQTASTSLVGLDLNRINHHPNAPLVPLWPTGSDRVPTIALGPEHMKIVAASFTDNIGHCHV